MLPYVMQALVVRNRAELAGIAAALGVRRATEAESAQSAVDAMAALVADIGVPSSLAEIGVTEDQLPRIAELALTVRRLVDNSALPADETAFRAILSAAFSGERRALQGASA